MCDAAVGAYAEVLPLAVQPVRGDERVKLVDLARGEPVLRQVLECVAVGDLVLARRVSSRDGGPPR